MRNKPGEPDNNDNGVKAKVPTIRLKLKVSSKEEPEKEKEKEKDKACEDVPVSAHLNVNDNETINTVSPVSQVSQVSESAPSQSHSSSARLICGTFKYRPFKLFPLLPPSSRYRVLVPPPYTDITRNPAVRLNYLWAASCTEVYTDDSDLVCVAVRDGWCKAEEMKGKELLIEVEVIDINEVEVNDPVSSHTCVSTLIIPRIYPAPHDGNHIRILSVTLDPAAVHLKRWRKHKRRRCNRVQPQLLTPKFKTQNVNV